MFKLIEERSDLSIVARVSYLEIYNEQLRDLLVSESDDDKAELSLHDVGGAAALVKGLCVKNVFTEDQALALLFEGETNRSMAAHALNARSTRSHCIFTIHLEVSALCLSACIYAC